MSRISTSFSRRINQTLNIYLVGEFSSILEIYVAVNSAYVLSPKLLKSLNDKITGMFQVVNDLLDQLESIIKSNKEYLSGLTSENLDKLKELANQQLFFETEVKDLRHKIEVFTETRATSPYFHYYCLYAALLSFSILIMGGFLIDCHHWGDEGMLLFITSSFTLFNIFVNLKGEIRIKSRWFYHSGYICSISMIAIGWVAFSYFSYKQGILYKECPYDFFITNKILILVIPFLHFIGYFLRAVRDKHTMLPKFEKELGKMISDVEKFNVKISGVVLAIDKLDNDKKDKRGTG